MGIGRWFPALLEQSERFLVSHSWSALLITIFFLGCNWSIGRPSNFACSTWRSETKAAWETWLSHSRYDLSFLHISPLRKPNYLPLLSFLSLKILIYACANVTIHFCYSGRGLIMECKRTQKEHCGGTRQVTGKILFTLHTSMPTRKYSWMET